MRRPIAVGAHLAGLACVALALVLSRAIPGRPGRDARAPAPESPPAVAPAAPRDATLLACGDILLSRTIARRIEKNGFSWPFEKIRDLVSGADIAFANLENPAALSGTPYPQKPVNVTFRADPVSLYGLAWAGLDAVSLANNHMNDYGPAALSETVQYLDLLGIAHCGAGNDDRLARMPAIVERNGVKLAFLAYAEPVWSVTEAGASSGGVAWAKPENLVADVAAARIVHGADIVVVSVHWGTEHMHAPGPFQTSFGHAAIDAGADLVLGHHPHVLQGIERYGKGIIVHSLGNFVFDMEADETYRTVAVEFSIRDARITGFSLHPVRIERGSYRPVPATGADGEAILKDMAAWSGALGTTLGREDGAASFSY